MARPKKPQDLVIEHARIGFLNFAGREGTYNEEGDRSFHLFLDPEVVEEFKREGWNVKQLRPRQDGSPGDFHIPIAVRYDRKPPKVVLISTRGGEPVKNELPEELIGLVDGADIANVDLIVSGSPWEMANGNSGVKAYLKSVWVTIAETKFDRKYESVREIGAGEQLAIEGYEPRNLGELQQVQQLEIEAGEDMVYDGEVED